MIVRKISNFFKVNGVHSIILKQVQITKFFGLVPYKETKNRLLVLSKPRLIFSIIAAFGIIILGMFLLLNIEHYGKIKRNPYMMLGLSRICCYYFYSVASVMYVNANHKKILKVFNNIREFDEILPLPKKKLRRFIFLLISLTAYSYFICVFYNMFATLTNYNVTNHMPVWIRLTILIPETSNVYFLTFVILIGFYIDLIHVKLKELTDKDSKEKKDRMIYTFQIKPGTKLETIEKYRILYGEIHDMKEDVNDMYSVHVLMTMSSLFIDLVFKLFVHIILFEYGKPDAEILPPIKYIQIFVGTVIVVFKMVIMIVICHQTAEKGKLMGITVHRLFERVRDVEIREELSIFSLELHQRDPSFSAAGFFNLDYTLLYEIAGAITMYLIILLQLHFPDTVEDTHPIKTLSYFL